MTEYNDKQDKRHVGWKGQRKDAGKWKEGTWGLAADYNITNKKGFPNKKLESGTARTVEYGKIWLREHAKKLQIKKWSYR